MIKKILEYRIYPTDMCPEPLGVEALRINKLVEHIAKDFGWKGWVERAWVDDKGNKHWQKWMF